jgi:hypothetical protein
MTASSATASSRVTVASWSFIGMAPFGMKYPQSQRNHYASHAKARIFKEWQVIRLVIFVNSINSILHGR